MRCRGFPLPLWLAVLLGLSALVFHHPARADDPPAAKKSKTGDKTSPKDIAGQWADRLARRDRIQASLDQLKEKHQTADAVGRRKIEADFLRIKAEFENEIRPGMEKIAPAIFEKNPDDHVAGLVAAGK